MCVPCISTGPEDEFVLVGRLDNLAMSYCCTKALADACSAPDALAQERGVRAIALFDHEECGSGSAQGTTDPMHLHTISVLSHVLLHVGICTDTPTMHGMQVLVAP